MKKIINTLFEDVIFFTSPISLSIFVGYFFIPLFGHIVGHININDYTVALFLTLGGINSLIFYIFLKLFEYFEK